MASLACSLIAFISHSAAMSMAAKIAMAVAAGHKHAADAQRLSLNAAFDLVAWSAGVIALALAFVGARGQKPRLRMLMFAAAAIANIWNLCMV